MKTPGSCWTKDTSSRKRWRLAAGGLTATKHMTLKIIPMLRLGFLNNQYGVEAIKRQLYLSDKIDHPNICSINDWRINDGYLLLDDELCCSNVSYIVTDFPNFKNLYFYLYNGRHFSEKMAKFFFEQIVEIVEILHKNGFT